MVKVYFRPSVDIVGMETASSGITWRSGLNFTRPALVSDVRSNGVAEDALAGSKMPGSRCVGDPYHGRRSVFSCLESVGVELKAQPPSPQAHDRKKAIQRWGRIDVGR